MPTVVKVIEARIRIGEERIGPVIRIGSLRRSGAGGRRMSEEPHHSADRRDPYTDAEHLKNGAGRCRGREDGRGRDIEVSSRVERLSRQEN